MASTRKERDTALVGPDQVVEDRRLLPHAFHGPVCVGQARCESPGQLVEHCLIAGPDRGYGTFIGFVVKFRQPSLEPALRPIQAMPFVGVLHDPSCWRVRCGGQGCLDFVCQRTDCRCEADGFPLGLPIDVVDKPEARSPLLSDFLRLLIVTLLNEL